MKQQAWWKEPTKGQWIGFGAAWFGWVMDAFDFMIFILVMPEIAKEFGVSNVSTTGSLALTLLVRLLGGMAAGWAGDRWGRKLPLMLSVVWFAVCDGAVAFAPTFGWILVLRTLFGFGMGAEWTAGATLAMENWPQRSRGIASGILQGSWAVGHMLAGIAAAVVVPLWGWRALFVIAALPALLVFPMRAWVPESPEYVKNAVRPKAMTFRELLAQGVFAKLAWGSLVMALGFGVYYGMTGLYPTMLKNELGFDSTGVARLTTLFNVGMLGGAVVIGALAARRGVVIAIVLPALLMLGAMPLYVGFVPHGLGAGAFLGGALGAGICGVTPMLLTAMFPSRIRARCVGFVYHAGASAAAFVPMGTAALAQYAGLSLAQSIGLVAGASLLLMALAILVSTGMLTAADEEAPVGALQPH